MLDDREFAEISNLHRDGMRATKEFRQRMGVPLENASLRERMAPMLSHYERLTGYKETNPNAVMHHQLSLYGPPCKHCAKPLRTPQAKLCGSCMFPVER